MLTALRPRIAPFSGAQVSMCRAWLSYPAPGPSREHDRQNHFRCATRAARQKPRLLVRAGSTMPRRRAVGDCKWKGAKMKAISIRQPWAHLIIHGGKEIENRSWNTKYRGPILIHAAKGMTEKEFCEAMAFVDQAVGGTTEAMLNRLNYCLAAPRGGIVGSAILADVVTQSESPWFTGPFGFVLTDVKPLPFRPMRGMLGLFEVPE